MGIVEEIKRRISWKNAILLFIAYKIIKTAILLILLFLYGEEISEAIGW